MPASSTTWRRAFAARDTPLQAEVSVLAEPAVHAQLAARGYRPSGFEHVLGHPLGAAIAALPEGVAIDVVAAGRRAHARRRDGRGVRLARTSAASAATRSRRPPRSAAGSTSR